MSIKENLKKIKPFYTLFIILAVASASFVLGRLEALRSIHDPIKIEYVVLPQTANALDSTSATTTEEKSTKTVVVKALAQSEAVIGSKSGKKYYYPWCGTVKRILPQNQVHFNSIEEARAAGFLPGGNCKGLK